MKTLHNILKLSGLAALLCVTLSTSAHAVNLVADGGFELNPAPDFSSAWTLNEPNGFSNVGHDGSMFQFAHSGSQYANLAPDFGATGSLSQVLNTTIGSFYTLTFFLANDVDSVDSSFEVFFDNVSVFATTTTLFGTSGDYVELTFSNLLATTALTTLEFQYRHDDDFWRLDDISVNAPNVPESGSAVVLFAIGLLAVESLRRKSFPSAIAS